MPIIHQHKAIFVHVPKTAGTSIESIMGVGGLNPLYLRGHKSVLINNIKYTPQHYTAKMLLNHKLVENYWNTYLKFSVVRNPYTRVLSEFFWQKGKTKQTLKFDASEFDCFLNSYYKEINTDHKLSQTFYLYHRGKLLIDKIFKFENLNQNFNLFANEHWPKLKPLVHIQKSSNKNNYINLIENKHKDFIYGLYENDFKHFNYQR